MLDDWGSLGPVRPIVKFARHLIQKLLPVSLCGFAFEEECSQVFGRQHTLEELQDSQYVPSRYWRSIKEIYLGFLLVYFQATGSLESVQCFLYRLCFTDQRYPH
jgi:hypothetical protein